MSSTKRDDYIPSPDRSKFLKEMDALRAELSTVRAAITKQKASIEKQKAGGAQSAEEQKLRDAHTEVLSEVKKLREAERKANLEATKIEESAKQKVSQLQLLRPKSGGPRTLKELDTKIAQLEQSVESGTLSLVAESKTLKEVSHLKGMRTSFGEASKLQAEIDEVRAKATAMRKQFDVSALKAASARKQELEKHLDGFKSARQSRKGVMDGLFDELRKLQQQQREITAKLDATRADFDAKQAEFSEKLKARKEQREQDEKKEKEEQARIRKIDAARAKLEAAKEPAFKSNIESAKKLLRLIDPSQASETSSASAPAAPAAKPSMHPPSRKSLKKKQQQQKEPVLKFDFGVVEALAALNISLPTSPEEVEETKSKLQEKIAFYEENNARVTEEKVKRAEAELNEVLKTE